MTTKLCSFCKQIFESNIKYRNYCSELCQQKGNIARKKQYNDKHKIERHKYYHDKIGKLRICPICKSEFKSFHRKIFCSEECKNKHIIIKHEDYRKTHREMYRTSGKISVEKIKNEIFNLLGGKCVNPFNIDHGAFLTESRSFQIDHVNGGGNKERRKIGNSYKYYRKILEAIKSGSKDYQCLCANCNWIKRIMGTVKA